MPRRIRVLYGFPATRGVARRLQGAAPSARIDFREIDSAEQVDALRDPDLEVLFADHLPADPSRLPWLRWMQYSGAGVDDLRANPPWRHGITCSTASGVNAVPIGEYVLGTLTRISQRVAERVANQDRRAWTSMDADLRGRPLRGATIAVVGYGSIGREVGRLASAVGMSVRAIKRDPGQRRDLGYRVPGTGDPDGVVPDSWHALDSLAEVVRDSDYVVLALPLTDETRHVIDRAVLAAMRPSAWLINVGRGALIDEAALEEALRSGLIDGGAIDVAVREPLTPDDRLWDVPRLMITPHVAGAGPDPWGALEDLFVENLRRYAEGIDLLNVVDPRAGY